VTQAEAVGGSSSTTAEQSQVSILRLSSEQIQELLRLLEAPEGGIDRLSGEVLWMLDNGAYYHMKGNSRVLQEFEKTLPVPIGLPNGTTTIATHQGSVKLGGNLKSNNVLYVPSLQ